MNERKRACSRCGEKFKKAEFESHWKDHEMKTEFKCNSCESVFVDNIALRRHGVKVHGTELKCETCNRKFKDLDYFIRHLRYGHAEKTFFCTMCSYATSVSALLRRHVQQTHKRQYMLHCDVCSKGFFDKARLSEHKNIHSGLTPHQCELCGKSFRLKHSLRAHRSKFHLELFSFKCKICQRGFATNDGLIGHINIHAENRKYICDHCGKHLSTESTLKEHRRMHTGEFPFKCEFCSKMYRAKKHLVRHTASHTGKEKEKNHECYSCRKKFSSIRACLLHTQKCFVQISSIP